MNIQAVLFDCDGLMFETEILTQQMWREEAEKAHVTLPDDFFLMITGGKSDAFRVYLSTHPEMESFFFQTREKRFDQHFWASVHTDCLNKEGLIELFTYLHQHSYQTAVCSSSPREYVETLLKSVSVDLKPDVLICGDQVKKTKPDPEIFLTAAKLLNVPPEKCLVLEDSKQGILAAKAAGMQRGFIPDTIVPDEEMTKALQYTFPSLKAVIEALSKEG